MSPRLTAPASDWSGHTIATRLTHCAHALYVHGELSREEWRRVSRSIHRRSTAERRLIRRQRFSRWRSKGALLIYVVISGAMVWTFAGWAVLG